MKYSIFVLGWLFLATLGQAASFDCTQATTKVEKLICSDSLLSKNDEDLMAIYAEALKETADQGLLRKQQREWLGKVRNRCNDVACIRNAYTARITQLASAQKVAVSECDYYLYQPLEFVDGSVKGCIKKEDINKLLIRKVESGFNDNNAHRFLKKGDQSINVENCNEYITGIANGYRPYSNFNISIASIYEKICGALVGLKNSVKPKSNNININKYLILEKIPAILLPVVVQDESDDLKSESEKGKSMQDYHKDINASYNEADKTLIVKYNGLGKSFELIAVSDFNRDGYADMLVFSTQYDLKDPYFSYGYFLITVRNKKNKLYDVLWEDSGCMNENSKYTCSSEYNWSPFENDNR